jgi:serine/threonine-protein kinase
MPSGVGRRAGRVGTVINGKWRIDARIGSGGMATVYAATSKDGERAAIKMLHTQLSRDEATKARFLREGYVANTIHHPGVVRVLEDGEAEDGSVYLALELLVGETMEARRVRCGGALPIDMALDYADQTLDALAAAHAKGIVHRDIKPDNVFLTTDGRVKLLDFGLARMKDARVEATAAGVTIGTPEFMPPEQALGRSAQVDARSDVWGLGATLFTAITGKHVHEADTLHQQLVASAKQRARAIRTLAPHVTPGVGFVIDKALELESSDRWPSAREMQKAFRDARGAPNKDFLADSLTVPLSPTAISNFGIPVQDKTEAVMKTGDVSSQLTHVAAPRSVSPPTPRMAPPPPPDAGPESPTYALSPEEVRALAARKPQQPSPRPFPVFMTPPQPQPPAIPRQSFPSQGSGSLPQMVSPQRMGARVIVFFIVALLFFILAMGAYALTRRRPPPPP